MNQETANNEQYDSLLAEIKQDIETGKQNAREQGDTAKTMTYWKIGQKIQQHCRKVSRSPRTRDHLLKQLSDDLNINKKVLTWAFLFYDRHRKLNEDYGMTWAHFKLLMDVRQSGKRRALERKVVRQKISVEELEVLIATDPKTKSSPRKGKQDQPEADKESDKTEAKETSEAKPEPEQERPPRGRRRARSDESVDEGEDADEEAEEEEDASASDESSGQLKVYRGRFYVYRVFESRNLKSDPGCVIVDSGFGILTEMYMGQKAFFRRGQLVESVKTESGFQLSKKGVRVSDLYTYVAYVENVLDDLTLDLVVDCGLGVWSKQKIALRGIRIPDGQDAAAQAKAFVEDKLKSCRYIVIKVRKLQGHAGLAADVIYQPNEKDEYRTLKDGTHLNQEMIDQGKAVLA